MEEITSLIKILQEDNIEAHKAASQLVSIGIPAIPAVLDAIRKDSESNTLSLREIILQIHDPEIVSILLKLLQEDNIDIVMTAFQGLGQSKDKRALKPLLDYLLDLQNLETYRSLAAKALGELGYREPIDVLLKVPDEAISKDMPRLAISTVIALAKLGNHDNASLAISLTQYKRAPIIRAYAVEALQYVVGKGMFLALKAALKDKYFEVRLNAVDAIFYLGVRDAFDELLSKGKDKNNNVSNNALARFQDITGEIFDDNLSIKTIYKWWEEYKKSFQKDICYRLGEPIWLPKIIALLDEPNTRGQIIKELQIITGKDFGFNPYVSHISQDKLLKNAQTWWRNEGHQFEAGQLYKYGYKQDIQLIF